MTPVNHREKELLSTNGPKAWNTDHWDWPAYENDCKGTSMTHPEDHSTTRLLVLVRLGSVSLIQQYKGDWEHSKTKTTADEPDKGPGH